MSKAYYHSQKTPAAALSVIGIHIVVVPLTNEFAECELVWAPGEAAQSKFDKVSLQASLASAMARPGFSSVDTSSWSKLCSHLHLLG